MQKYFISGGISSLSSAQIWKKWSTAFLLVKITAVWCNISTFCLRNSFNGTGSTWMKGIKSTFRRYLSESFRYGEFASAGGSWVTRMLFTFRVLSLTISLISTRGEFNLIESNSILSWSKPVRGLFQWHKCTKIYETTSSSCAALLLEKQRLSIFQESKLLPTWILNIFPYSDLG